MVEIERKWYLCGTVPIEDVLERCVEANTLRQGYIVASPVHDVEVRVRASSSIRNMEASAKYTMTVKGAGDLSRTEIEIPIGSQAFRAIYEEATRHKIEKIRYIVPIEGTDLLLEIDEYRGRLTGLFILEVEFESEEQAKAFVVPSWLGQAIDVTNDCRFKNKNLSKRVNIPKIGDTNESKRRMEVSVHSEGSSGGGEEKEGVPPTEGRVLEGSIRDGLQGS